MSWIHDPDQNGELFEQLYDFVIEENIEEDCEEGECEHIYTGMFDCDDNYYDEYLEHLEEQLEELIRKEKDEPICVAYSE